MTDPVRKILHIDMDAFYASVEQRDSPELSGLPVVVGGKPESRGVVAACSYEARKYGIHSAMPCSRAAKLCRDVVFVPPRFDAYREASSAIHDVFRSYTGMIEPLSLDEAYLDVTEKASEIGTATEVALMIKRDIKKSTGLTASAGVSYNKFLAKIASDMDKPDGLFVIRPDQALAFIGCLAIRKFFGVGKVTEQKMQALGIYTGADLRQRSELELQTEFGQSGSYYYRVARGIDDRPVRAHRVRKSIGQETTFSEDVINKQKIWQTLLGITENLEASLERRQLVARTLTLKLRYADFQLKTRSKTDPRTFVSKEDMNRTLPELLRKTEIGQRPIRLIGVTLSNLHAEASQTSSSRDEVRESPQMGLF